MGDDRAIDPLPLEPEDWEDQATIASEPPGADDADWDEKLTSVRPSAASPEEFDQQPTENRVPIFTPPVFRDAAPTRRPRSSLQPVDIGGSSLVLPGDGDWEDAGPTEVEQSGARAARRANAVGGGRAPQTLDFETRYAFRRLIGKGGMGEVNLYTDNTIGRDVAMKVIRGEHSRGQARAQARFVREARVQGQLEHPAIVPVYDLGADPEGRLYFTMKRVRGRSLEEVFEGLSVGDSTFRTQYSRRKLLTAFNNVCLSMAFAHARGVLHRDLKPANIMLGDFGEVYVLDWGLAKIGDAEDLPAEEGIKDGSNVQYTVDGDIVGTLGFMAPEQLAGASAAIDHRADIYSLGAILFQMLTHQPLHSGEVFNELVLSTLDAAPAPSQRAPDAGIAPELDQICLKALARDPADRFDSAADLSRALEAFLDGDRDLALRREAAREHAQRAAEAWINADGSPEEASRRGEAMREVSAALGMDPDNEIALQTFYRLMTEPPKQFPAEAREALDESRREAKRAGMKMAAVVYLSLLALGPLVLYMGVKSWVAFGALMGSVTLSFLLSIYHLKWDKNPLIALDHLCAATFTVVVSTVIVGPLMLVPVVALATTAAYGAATNVYARRVWVVVLGVLGLAIPVGLELGGILPSTFAVIDGQIVIQSMLFELKPTSALIMLLGVYIPVIAGSGWYVAKIKSAYSDLEERMRLQAWQLSQIVPEKLRRATATA
ncbi:MAG: serine/threonine protein kinase [Deltaproteobacteria bacterium]|nr:serine/threonine protein kinase [Deltaproteobacteria bacterium]